LPKNLAWGSAKNTHREEDVKVGKKEIGQEESGKTKG